VRKQRWNPRREPAGSLRVEGFGIGTWTYAGYSGGGFAVGNDAEGGAMNLQQEIDDLFKYTRDYLHIHVTV
jgi:hypothetical protein